MIVLNIMIAAVFANMILRGLWGIVLGNRLIHHLEMHHAEAHRRFLLDPSAILPWNSNNYVRFVFFSPDDLGDPMVAALKASLRSSLRGTILQTIIGFMLITLAAFAIDKYYQPHRSTAPEMRTTVSQ